METSWWRGMGGEVRREEEGRGWRGDFLQQCSKVMTPAGLRFACRNNFSFNRSLGHGYGKVEQVPYTGITVAAISTSIAIEETPGARRQTPDARCQDQVPHKYCQLHHLQPRLLSLPVPLPPYHYWRIVSPFSILFPPSIPSSFLR